MDLIKNKTYSTKKNLVKSKKYHSLWKLFAFFLNCFHCFILSSLSLLVLLLGFLVLIPASLVILLTQTSHVGGFYEGRVPIGWWVFEYHGCEPDVIEGRAPWGIAKQNKQTWGVVCRPVFVFFKHTLGKYCSLHGIQKGKAVLVK